MCLACRRVVYPRKSTVLVEWCGGRLCTVIFEIRHDSEGEYYYLITAWQATQYEEQRYVENV
jgi:hypothetical protein